MIQYKYFIIADRDNKIIYGECIKWQCDEVDEINVSDLTINLVDGFKARFFVSNRRADRIVENQNTVAIFKDMLFKYEEEYGDFVTQRFDESVYNPLFDRCCKIRMFIGHEIVSNAFQFWTGNTTEFWMETHKNLLNEIKLKFDLDLMNRPELVNSYAFYEPTRIIVDYEFIDQPIGSFDGSSKKLRVKFVDEFNAYDHATYSITGYFRNSDTQTKTGNISDKNVIFACEESPRVIEIKILNQGQLVYEMARSCDGIKRKGALVTNLKYSHICGFHQIHTTLY